VKTAGIFGPKLSGKTTLARHLSKQFWLRARRRSLVLDPHLESWGGQAWVTTNEPVFWEAVWKSRGDLVIVEEAAATIRRERELIPLFTRLRHLDHKLIIVGHDGTDLLPVMRRQFDTIYLFVQPAAAVEIWQKDLPQCKGLDAAAELRQFEFLRCELFQRAQRLKLQL